MSNILDKLNLLVKSSLNNFLGEAAERASTLRPRISAARLGKDIDNEIAALRKRIDDALNEEDAMQDRLGKLQEQIASIDAQADDAVQRGDEPTARHLLQQMRQLEQQAAMLQADLEQHRRSTSDFIQRVNMMEAMVSDARREQQEQAANKQESVPEDSPKSEAAHSPGDVLSNLLREARERVESALTPTTPPTQSAQSGSSSTEKPSGEATHIPIKIERTTPIPPVPTAPAATPEQPVQKIPINVADDKSIDDDLVRRRTRLSNPSTKPADPDKHSP
jgi:phage shock protein A